MITILSEKTIISKLKQHLYVIKGASCKILTAGEFLIARGFDSSVQQEIGRKVGNLPEKV